MSTGIFVAVFKDSATVKGGVLFKLGLYFFKFSFWLGSINISRGWGCIQEWGSNQADTVGKLKMVKKIIQCSLYCSELLPWFGGAWQCKYPKNSSGVISSHFFQRAATIGFVYKQIINLTGFSIFKFSRACVCKQNSLLTRARENLNFEKPATFNVCLLTNLIVR